MKRYLVFLGHVGIVVLCVLAAIVLNGMFVATTYSVNGTDITGLSEAVMGQKLRTGPLVATVHIGPWIEFPLPSLEFGSLLMPATTAVLLLIIYVPGLIWPSARRFAIRAGITAVIVGATYLVLGYGGAYRV
jgi:hypothetical protein